MKTITIYELLGMIKDGKELPKKVKVLDVIYEFDDHYKDYLNEELNRYLFVYMASEEEWKLSYFLNVQVEILEEEPRDIEVCGSLFTKSEYDKLAHSEEEKKIPEKLESYISCGWNGTCKDLKRDELFEDLKKIGSKINEIIDYLKSKGDE